MSTNANLQGHVMAIARTQKEGISAGAILALRAMLPYQMDVKVTRTRLLLSQLHAKKKEKMNPLSLRNASYSFI